VKNLDQNFETVLVMKIYCRKLLTFLGFSTCLNWLVKAFWYDKDSARLFEEYFRLLCKIE